MHKIPEKLNVLLFMDPSRAPIHELKEIDPERLRINAVPGQAFVDSGGMHPPTSGLWKERPWETSLSQAELNELLENAHILVFTLPYPKHLLERMPNLMYAQYLFAGISDLRYSDLWGSNIKVGSARGFVDTLPIAEMIIGACFYFAKNLGIASNQTRLGEFDAKAYNLKLMSNKTIAIIGLGGIGQEVARLAKLLGMKVLASKRSVSKRSYDIENVDILFPPNELESMLADSDFVALSPVLTENTERMINAESIQSMKDGAVLLNVGRGELIDEAALIEALKSGKLSGAYLDVYDNEWEKLPNPVLMSLPTVLMTPHNSGHVDDRDSLSFGILKENIRRFISGKELINEVDWDRGY